jgi:hypothetical protein
MSASDDDMRDMRTFPHGDQIADALLGGRVLPDDAPPGYQSVAALVRIAQGPASEDEHVGEASVVAAMMEAISGNAPKPTAGRKGSHNLRKLISAKLLAGAVVVVVGGGAAAAATGSLPPSLQTPLSHDLSSVGVSIPHPGDHASGSTAVDHVAGTGSGSDASGTNAGVNASGVPAGSTTTTSSGPVLTAPDVVGLCQSYATATTGNEGNGKGNGNGNGKPKAGPGDSQAFSQLAAAAQAKGQTIPEFCAAATPSANPAPVSTPTPGPASSSSATTTTTTESPEPSITPANVAGQCTAYAAGNSNGKATGNSQAFAKLTAAAQAEGKTVPEFCAEATAPAPASPAAPAPTAPTSTATTGPANPNGPTTTPNGKQPGNSGSAHASKSS